jgi:hypothetical protein
MCTVHYLRDHVKRGSDAALEKDVIMLKVTVDTIPPQSAEAKNKVVIYSGGMLRKAMKCLTASRALI